MSRRSDGRTVQWTKLHGLCTRSFGILPKNATGKTKWITSRLLFACRMWNLPTFLTISSKRIKLCPFICVIFVFVAFHSYYSCLFLFLYFLLRSVCNKQTGISKKILQKKKLKTSSKKYTNRITGRIWIAFIMTTVYIVHWNWLKILGIVFRHHFIQKGTSTKNCHYKSYECW